MSKRSLRWARGQETHWRREIDQLSVFVTMGALFLGVVLWFVDGNVERATIPVSLALAFTSAWVLNRLNRGLERQQRLEFDPVTSEIFRNLKDNVKLSNRLHRVDVEEKRQLGMLLAGKEGPDTQLTLFSVLVGAKTPSLIDGDEPDPARSKGGYRRVFFESGSTLSYLGLQLTRCDYYRKTKSGYSFTTNNVLLSQIFLFQENTTIRLLDGTPKGQYGATFGSRVPAEEPRGSLLHWRRSRGGEEQGGPNDALEYTGSREQFIDMGKDLAKFFADETPEFVVMTSSRFSVTDGPHVGSLQNRDFKENLFILARAHRIPVLFILYEDKVESRPIDTNACLAIFGRDAVDSSAERSSIPAEKLGIANIARAIANGEMTLVITSRETPADVSSERPRSRRLEGTPALFQHLRTQGAPYLDAGRSIELLESPDRRVHIFMARPYKGAEESYTRFLRSIEVLNANGYRSQPVVSRST